MYAVVIVYDPENGSYGATAPDFDMDVIGIGKSEDEALSCFRNALASYVKVLREDGKPIPEPRHTVAMIDLAAVV